jgi:hypothetical protein
MSLRMENQSIQEEVHRSEAFSLGSEMFFVNAVETIS